MYKGDDLGGGIPVPFSVMFLSSEGRASLLAYTIDNAHSIVTDIMIHHPQTPTKRIDGWSGL